MHGAARASIGGGFVFLGLAAAAAISTALGGSLGDAVVGITLLAAAGIGMIASGALRLPGWARLRGRQMEALAAQIANPPNSASPPASTHPTA